MQLILALLAICKHSRDVERLTDWFRLLDNQLIPNDFQLLLNAVIQFRMPCIKIDVVVGDALAEPFLGLGVVYFELGGQLDCKLGSWV